MEKEILRDDDTSDEMIDIRIEESLVRESLMKIDASNFKDDLKLLMLYFGIILIAFLIGCTNLHPVNSESITSPINTSKTLMSFGVSDLSSKNLFISFFIYFSRIKSLENAQISLNLTYEAKCSDRSILVHSSSKPFYGLVLSSENSLSTHLFNFYFDQIIDYDNIEINLQFSTSSSEFQNATLTVYYGEQKTTMILMISKLVFSVIQLLLLVNVLLKLKATPIKYWHLEQKLTVPLLFITIFYNNPFEFIQMISPSYAFLIYNCIVRSLFSTYFQFFILALFDSLKYKNRKTQACFFIPKIIFIFVIFLVSVFHSIYDVITSFDTSPSLEDDQTESVFSFTQNFLYLIYFAWFLISVVLARYRVDITERYKFNVYFATCLLSLLILAVSYLMQKHLIFFKNKTLNLFVAIATQNMFVILMFWFHYPYEVIDEQYSNGETAEIESKDSQEQHAFLDQNSQQKEDI